MNKKERCERIQREKENIEKMNFINTSGLIHCAKIKIYIKKKNRKSISKSTYFLIII